MAEGQDKVFAVSLSHSHSSPNNE
ncbi:hypothetical protein CCACVL1_14173 [Corchorus capsularis]|uniref:Uncharacterized protein n=1 Tax=Corchorus capsularis TaxID=210143 RepID=A0A1R3I836_COCAP|nr:hypothetical protein CCACVL1_14173 [Corchorus capsularis]